MVAPFYVCLNNRNVLSSIANFQFSYPTVVHSRLALQCTKNPQSPLRLKAKH